MKKELLVASALAGTMGLAGVAEAATASFSGNVRAGVTGDDVDSTTTATHSADQKSSLSKLMDLSFSPKEKSIVVDYNGPNLINGNSGQINEILINNNQIKIQCSTNGGSLLVLSEIYYNPGWKCKIDGKNSAVISIFIK